MNSHVNALLIITVAIVILVIMIANISLALATVIITGLIVLIMVVGDAANHLPAVIRAVFESLRGIK